MFLHIFIQVEDLALAKGCTPKASVILLADMHCQLPPCNLQQLKHVGHNHQTLGQHSLQIHMVFEKDVSVNFAN
jgi:hypothetical protein